MNIFEFQDKYSNLISNFEETTGRNAIWHDEITKRFIKYLQEKNIKINYRLSKTLIPKRYNHLYHISEFWLKFLQENTYFTKKRVTEDYIREYYSPKNRCESIRKEFWSIIRYLIKYGIIEHYSKKSFKIHKEKVSLYS